MAINWQIFGSNGQETADYSRGLLERFTRRAPSDWHDASGNGNPFKKVIENPRLIRYRVNPHFSIYFDGKAAVNSDSKYIPPWYGNEPILADKIVLNHYYTKSREEYVNKKMPRGSCCMDDKITMEWFYRYDRNEEFDDGILKYRAAREKTFSPESNEERFRRVEKALIETLTQYLSDTAPEDFFVDKLETFLTCRFAAEKLGLTINDVKAEEIALAWIYTTVIRSNAMNRSEGQMFLRALPEILTRPFPICKEINRFTQEKILPNYCAALKNGDIHNSLNDWIERSDWNYIQKLLRLIK